VQTLIAQSNVIVVSIGGNDLWGDTTGATRRRAIPRRDEGVLESTSRRS
jgi:lysophospholipase L1-like esterase